MRKESPTTCRDMNGNIHTFKKMDGEVSRYSYEVFNFLNENSIQESKDRQGKFYENIFYDLKDLEINLDKYSLKLEEIGSTNKNSFFPNINTQVNVIASINIGNLNPEYYPKFSEKTINLAKKLDEVSYEPAQIIKEEYPELISKVKENYGLSNAENNYILTSVLVEHGLETENEDERYINIIKNKILVPNGLLEKHFDKLNLKEKREQRLTIGKDLLSCLFEETKSSFNGNKKSLGL